MFRMFRLARDSCGKDGFFMTFPGAVRLPQSSGWRAARHHGPFRGPFPKPKPWRMGESAPGRWVIFTTCTVPGGQVSLKEYSIGRYHDFQSPFQSIVMISTHHWCPWWTWMVIIMTWNLNNIFFVGRFYGIFSWTIPSGKLSVRPWQSSGLEDEFPLKMGDSQGPTVNLPLGGSSHL